ncbi:hypothetical protein ACSFBI_03585 [Variovorax sp. RB3P1]|uniref:hypothetical protein n=1 Tax=Variovorax sp. RB3P1 TaxID=3443732 RepID=UPI003F45BB8F
MTGSGQWALTVNELEEGEFHFTVLVAVDDPSDSIDPDVPDHRLSYRPVITDDSAHGTAGEAWMAGALALADHLYPLTWPVKLRANAGLDACRRQTGRTSK